MRGVEVERGQKPKAEERAREEEVWVQALEEFQGTVNLKGPGS
jgi:hypothetical protein